MTSPRLSPLHPEHEALGATLTDFAGWRMPVSYRRGTVAEHLACRRHVAVFDVSHLATLVVSGRRERERLRGLLTYDLARVDAGSTQYTLLLDEAGGIVDDLVVWRVGDDEIHVLANAANATEVHRVVGGDDQTRQRVLLALQGPQARRVLQAWDPRADVERHRVRRFTVAGHEMVAAGTGYTGEDGIELTVPVEAAVDVWRQWLALGAEPAGLGARDTLRLEAGLPLHGAELTREVSPFESGVGWAVDFGHDFRGADAARHARDTATHHRVGIATTGRRPPRAGSEVIVDGAVVGVVTSGNWSPVLEHGIALARVPRSVVRGASVVVRVREHHLEGSVVSLPFVRRDSATP